MSFLDLSSVGHSLPDGRPLLSDVSLRVRSGDRVALIGANGAGKSTLLGTITGDVTPDSGAVTVEGRLGVMRQFVSGTTVRELLLSVAPHPIRLASERLVSAERRMVESETTDAQLAFAAAMSDWGDAGGYELEVLWDVCTVNALGIPLSECEHRGVSTLSGGERKRLVLEALFHGGDDVLLLDEPDNSLDVPGKQWLEEQLLATAKGVLFVSHDRELLARAATSIVTLELGAAGNTAWTHAGGFDDYHDARRRRFERLDELRRRWDEEHGKLRALMLMYKQKASYNSDMASRYRAARTRLDRFEGEGPPERQPVEQKLSMRLHGGRTGKQALVCRDLELTGLVRPFDLDVRLSDRVAVLGSNGTGKSHFLRLLAAGGTEPVGGIEPVPHKGSARLGARVRPGWFAQNRVRPDLAGRTLLDILHCGDEHRDGLPREEASRTLSRYELARAAEQRFDTLSGGQQARVQILLLELGGATMLLLDEPTDNLDLVSADVLQRALDEYAGTVLAVTHDRWFARDFDRYVVFGDDGTVYESGEAVLDNSRTARHAPSHIPNQRS